MTTTPVQMIGSPPDEPGPPTGRKPQPRTLLSDPKKFGKASNPRFPYGDSDWGLTAGAREQHRIAWAMHNFARKHRMTLLDVAEQTGIDYQRLHRVLRGAAWISIEDVGRMVSVFPEAFGRRTGPRSRYPSPQESRLRMVLRRERRIHPKKLPGEDVIDDIEWPEPAGDWNEHHGPPVQIV